MSDLAIGTQPLKIKAQPPLQPMSFQYKEPYAMSPNVPYMYMDPELIKKQQALAEKKLDIESKQLDLTQQQATSYQKSLPITGAASIAGAGMQAGAQVIPTPSAELATLQTLGAGAQGALSGALTGAAIGAAGGPIGVAGGAAIGGLTGLVAGGLQAFFGLKESRRQRREQDKQAREIKKLNEQARQDQLRQQRFQNKMQLKQFAFNQNTQNLQSKWTAIQQAQATLQNLMNQDERLKQIFISRAR